MLFVQNHVAELTGACCSSRPCMQNTVMVMIFDDHHLPKREFKLLQDRRKLQSIGKVDEVSTAVQLW